MGSTPGAKKGIKRKIRPGAVEYTDEMAAALNAYTSDTLQFVVSMPNEVIPLHVKAREKAIAAGDRAADLPEANVKAAGKDD